jgi:hypothetical protein
MGSQQEVRRAEGLELSHVEQSKLAGSPEQADELTGIDGMRGRRDI